MPQHILQTQSNIIIYLAKVSLIFIVACLYLLLVSTNCSTLFTGLLLHSCFLVRKYTAGLSFANSCCPRKLFRRAMKLNYCYYKTFA